MPRRSEGLLLELESGVLVAAFDAYPESIYPYGYAYDDHDPEDAAKLINNGTIYRVFGRLVLWGMLERAEPVEQKIGIPPQSPHFITEIGVDALIRNNINP